MSSKSKIILSISVLAIVAIIIYVFSANDTWLGDDIFYKFNWAAKSNLEEINSISDIIASQWVHYFTYNGRYVAHWIVQLFCGILGQNTFAICNGLMYIAFILLILKLSGSDFFNPLAVLSASLLTLIAYDTYYAPSCQVGYVWMFSLVIIWIYIFFKTNTKSIFKLILIFLFSIMAGNSQEAITIGVSGALIIYAITNFKKVTPSQWTAFFGFGIGALLVACSPSTIAKAEKLSTPLFNSLLYMISALKIFYIFIAILLIKTFTHSINLKEFYSKNNFYIHTIIILFLFNIIIGGCGNRQFLGIDAMSIILTLRLLNNAHFRETTLIIVSILVALLFSYKWIIISQSKNDYNRIYELFSDSKSGTIYYNLTQPNYYPEYFHIIHIAKFIPQNPIGFINSINYLYQSETGDPTKVLKIYPECLQNINDSTLVENQVVEFDEGCFVVVQSKENPADFIVKRTLDLFIYKRPHSDYKFSWDNPQFEGPNYKANIIYQAVPFVTNDSIIIQ